LIVSLLIYNYKDDALMYTICVALTFFTLGGQFSMFPAANAKIFGIKNGA
jgi:hypothetical protein